VATRSLLDALRDFATSTRGTDKMRMDAAQKLRELGHWPSEPVQMWAGGEWRELALMGFEISPEPIYRSRTPEVEEIGRQGLDALKAGDGRRGEDLFRRCIALEGEVPDLLNNLALAVEKQGRTAEAHDLIRQTHARWPDYFFGRIALARLAIHAGNLDEADALLAPLRQRHKLHTTEFYALVGCQVEFHLARHEDEAAGSWVDMLRAMEPDHPLVEQLEERIEMHAVLRTAQDRIGWRTSRSKRRN
jgi:thioredoxin-like negative regulator of GroEL